ncbi:MAG TPA: HRDC domain-containing protein [Candidatus Saccharimonadales bacterium]|nr:HRDC domain-containing protein [Candidatus Saccharimonadales bacterium]
MTQDEALAILESGQSALLTGAAGTGKTYVLNKFIKRAKKRGLHVAVTATTGLAATHLNGTTIHAWSGIGVHDSMDAYAAAKLGASRQDIIRKADVLVIDEISMLHDFRLDMVDEILRLVREDATPFGGMQVILCGDFFQLPPVNRRDSRQGSFVISSEAWQKNVFTVCYLEKQYRQSKDEAYTQILNGIRAGVLTRNQLALLDARKQATPDPFTPLTRLLTVNVDVDSVNEEQLDSLEGDVHEYYMDTHGGKNYVEQLQRSCLAPETLRLKLGAQVMCIKNAQDRSYVNGSLGVVTGFEKNTDMPEVELLSGRRITVRPETWELMDGDKRRAQLMQLPLRLAWAITVHKSQGMTLDAARIDLSRAFVEGMGYVALSRVRSLKHLILDGLNGMALRVSPMAKQIDAELRTRSAQALEDHAAAIAQWQADEASGAHEAAIAQKAAAASVDPELFEALRTWRFALAQSKAVPPYVIADNKALEAVAAQKPTTEKALQNVPGFGPKRVENYGADILKIVQEHQTPDAPDNPAETFPTDKHAGKR